MIKSITHSFSRVISFKILLLLFSIVYSLFLASCSDEDEDTETKALFTYTPKTQAFFTYTINEEDPSEVSFSNISTKADAYLWDFGDGVTSTEIHPTHRFEINGDFNVSLTAFANDVETNTNQIVTITCPYGPDMFTGSYTYYPIDIGVFGQYPFGISRTIEIKYLSPFTRSIEFYYIPVTNYHKEMEFIFDINCNVVVPHDSLSTKLGCGSAILLGAPDPEFYATINPTNDSLINITFKDLLHDGGCGAPPENIRFKLVKN